MKRVALPVLLLLFGMRTSVHAQMGMDMFKRPSFTKVFHPVVGQGAQYEMTSKRGQSDKTSQMEMGIVGKESVDGKDAYWMEMVMQMETSQPMVAKVLMGAGDFQMSRMIMQMPGRPAMEMPTSMTAANRDKVSSSMEDWHSVGTESVTVPAGTFSCEHWKNDKTGGEVWTSEKVTPFGLVKEMSNDHSMVLLKVLNDYPDRITGPVQPFDPQMMMQQQMQRRQQQPQQ
jgi:hypothetical protein